MTRKTKILCALAIGAVALLIGSGIARCSLQKDTVIEQGQEPTAAIVEEVPSGQLAQQPDDGKDGFADLKNTSWTTEDGKSTLSIIQGAFIEHADGQDLITYYTIDSETADGDNLTVMLATSKSLNDTEKLTVCSITPTSDGGQRLVCDVLSQPYVKDKPVEVAIEVKGIDSNLTDLFGQDSQAFESVLADRAKKVSPFATAATWDKEVWIDYAKQTYLTNFTLNDVASTIVTVKMDSTGKLVAQ